MLPGHPADLSASPTLRFFVFFYGCFLVIEAHGGRCFRTPNSFPSHLRHFIATIATSNSLGYCFRGFPSFHSSTTGALSLPSTASVTDGEWHSVSVRRTGRVATMTINEHTGGDEHTVQITANGPRSIINFPDDLYVGGIALNYNMPDSLDAAQYYSSLVGCIQGFVFNRVTLDHGAMESASPGVRVSTLPGFSAIFTPKSGPTNALR